MVLTGIILTLFFGLSHILIEHLVHLLDLLLISDPVRLHTGLDLLLTEYLHARPLIVCLVAFQ